MIPMWHLVLPVYPELEPVPLGEAWQQWWEAGQQGPALKPLVAALYRAGRYQEAATLVGQASQGRGDLDQSLAYVACLCQISRTSVALSPTPWQELWLAARDQPVGPAFHLVRAWVLYRRNLPLAAKEALDEAGGQAGTAYEASEQTLRGLLLVDEQRATEALGPLTRATHLVRGSADCLGAALNLAFAQLAAGTGLQRTPIHRQLDDLEPQHPGRAAWAYLQSCCARGGSRLPWAWEALSAYRAVPGSARQQAVCYRHLARVYRDLGQPARAVDALRCAAKVLVTAEEYDALAEADLELSEALAEGDQAALEALDLAVPALLAESARRFTIVGSSGRTAFRDGLSAGLLDRVLRLALRCGRLRLAAELVAWSRLTGRLDLTSGPLGGEDGSMLRPGPRLVFRWPGELDGYLRQAARRYALAPTSVHAPTVLGLGAEAYGAEPPAEVQVHNHNGGVIRLLPDGQEELVFAPEHPVRMHDAVAQRDFLVCQGRRIELVDIRYDKTEGLPAEEPGVLHLVNQPVAMQHRDRRDLVFPHRAVGCEYAPRLARLAPEPPAVASDQ